MHFAGVAAALLSSAPIPPGSQPSQAELEAALRAHYVLVFTYPTQCRSGRAPGCMKPPKAIKVRNYDCQATGTDSTGGSILFCRVSYQHKGGALAYVTYPDRCVPLRASKAASIDNGGTGLAWEVALMEAKGRCPGGRI
jgi:hypothetical protein